METILDFKENLEDPQHLAELLFDGNEELANRVSDLLGGCEDYTDLKKSLEELHDIVSLEDMGDAIMKTVRRIIEYIKKIIQKVIDSGPILTAAAAYVNFRAENIKIMSRGVKRSNNSRKFLVDRRVQNLCVRYIPITNVSVLLGHLRQLDLVIMSYVRGLDTVIIRPASVIPNYVNVTTNADDLAAVMLSNSPLNLAQPDIYKDENGRYESRHLMGNHQIVINKNRTGNGDVYDEVKDITVRLVPYENNPRPLPPSIEFEHFNIQALDSIIKRVLAIVENVQTANGESVRPKRIAKIRTLQASLERFESSLADQTDEQIRENSRRIILLVETYIDWLTVPYLDLFALTMRNLTAVLNVCEANLK